MLSQICLRQIKDNYYFGYYGNFGVVIDKNNGFVNATKLCNDGGKKFFYWKETKMSKDLVGSLGKFNAEKALDDGETREP